MTLIHPAIGSDQKQISSIQPVPEVSPFIIDEIELKQKEMRDTVVLVQANNRSGSGVIIDCLETDTEEIFEYRVLTNAHIIQSRFITYLRGVNSITGKIKTETVEISCGIITFDHANKDWDQHTAEVIAEDVQYDLAILSFLSDQEFAIANMANEKMLSQVRVFDEVFAVGCQLGRTPMPTTGIVARILTKYDEEREWIIYLNTAQIAPGSSGGGLFKEYNGHYYLIGVPYQVSVARNGQFIPHLASAISLTAAKDLLDHSLISYP